jgi:hypothetical protein
VIRALSFIVVQLVLDSTKEEVFLFTLLLLTIQPPDAGGGRSGGDGGQHQKNRRQRLRLLPWSTRWSYSIHFIKQQLTGVPTENFCNEP